MNRGTGLPDIPSDTTGNAAKGGENDDIAITITSFADFRPAARLALGIYRCRPRRDRRARQPPMPAGAPGAWAYDGTWNVTFATQAGNCSSPTACPSPCRGTRVSSAGGGKVTGGVSRGGSVAVRITVGASGANGSGRLVGNSGAGRWSGIITGDRCSGIWQATRS